MVSSSPSCSIVFCLGTYISFRFLLFFSVVCLNGNFHYSASFIFCCWLSLCLVIWPRLGNPLVSQNPREVCASYSQGQNLVCAYTNCSYGQISISYIISSGLYFLAQSCLVLYSFCVNLLHSLIIWLIVSSLLTHNLYWLFCCVLSIFDLT